MHVCIGQESTPGYNRSSRYINRSRRVHGLTQFSRRDGSMFRVEPLFQYTRSAYSPSEKASFFLLSCRRSPAVVARLTNHVKFIFKFVATLTKWRRPGVEKRGRGCTESVAAALRMQSASDRNTFGRRTAARQEGNDEKTRGRWKKGWHEHEIEIIEVTSKTREPRGYPCGNIIGSWDRGGSFRVYFWRS